MLFEWYSKNIHEIKESEKSFLKNLHDKTCEIQQTTFVRQMSRKILKLSHLCFDRWSLCSLCRPRCHTGTGHLQCQRCQGGLWRSQRPLLHADGLSARVGDAVHWSVYTPCSLYLVFFLTCVSCLFSCLSTSRFLWFIAVQHLISSVNCFTFVTVQTFPLYAHLPTCLTISFSVHVAT